MTRYTQRRFTTATLYLTALAVTLWMPGSLLGEDHDHTQAGATAQNAPEPGENTCAGHDGCKPAAGVDAHDAHEDEAPHADHDEHEAGHDEHDAHDEDAHDEHDGHDEHDEHDEDAHDEHDGHDEHDEHDGHDEDEDTHDEHAGHEGHDEDEGAIRLTPAQQKRFGIRTARSAAGTLATSVSLTGSVAFNGDRLVHLVPRAPGIAISVAKGLGEPVAAGETLASIESSELATAKLDYLAAVTEVGCCLYELPRAQAIHDNVLALLKTLADTSDTQTTATAQISGEMGTYGSALVTAHTDYVLARRAYAREQQLRDKQISSERELLEAETAFKQKEAAYVSLRDAVAYEVQQKLLETTRERQLAEFAERTLRQQLGILGLSDESIASLAVNAPPAAAPEAPCSDPNCTDCKGSHAAPASDERLGLYSVRAPFAGVVVQKHITRGERVTDDSEIFTVADLSSVWVNLTVHAKDLQRIKAGQQVVLEHPSTKQRVTGAISMVTPFIDEISRSATARVLLDNSDGAWTPGTFATAFLSNTDNTFPIVVPRAAVQLIDGASVVFIEHEGAFEMAPVTLGPNDRTHVAVTAGLELDTPYVSEGAFHLKSTVVTSTLDSHAGHGH